MKEEHRQVIYQIVKGALEIAFGQVMTGKFNVVRTNSILDEGLSEFDWVMLTPGLRVPALAFIEDFEVIAKEAGAKAAVAWFNYDPMSLPIIETIFTNKAGVRFVKQEGDGKVLGVDILSDEEEENVREGDDV